MLPRTESIFNIGEEGTMKESNKDTITSSCCRGPPEDIVGLRILIQHHRWASNIVVKSALKSRELNSVGSRRIPASWPEFGFLKACLFCGKELSLEKDVYMYRGDQGFCSEECRSKQILSDERREIEASKREWQRIQRRQNSAMPKIREYSDRRRRRITIGA